MPAAISLHFDHDGNQVVSHHLHFHRRPLFDRWILHIIAADEHAWMLVLIAAAQRAKIHVFVQLLRDGSFVGEVVSAQRGVAVDALEDRVITQLFR